MKEIKTILELKSFKHEVIKNERKNFKIVEGKAFFIENPSKGFNESNNDLIVNKVKILIKKVPWLFFVIYRLVGASFVGKSSVKAIKNIPKDSLILNLGSGVTNLRDDVINVDFYPFKTVHAVADIADLPFRDNVADAVVCEYVLEHVPDPLKIVSEMHRVLKNDAIVYITVPFVATFHSSPNDFYRWSKTGIRQMFKDFEEVECGVRSGYFAAVDYILAEAFSTLLSFGSKKIHQILFMILLVVFAPLCYLDYLIWRYPTSENAAYGFYYIGKKKCLKK